MAYHCCGKTSGSVDQSSKIELSFSLCSYELITYILRTLQASNCGIPGCTKRVPVEGDSRARMCADSPHAGHDPHHVVNYSLFLQRLRLEIIRTKNIFARSDGMREKARVYLQRRKRKDFLHLAESGAWLFRKRKKDAKTFPRLRLHRGGEKDCRMISSHFTRV